MNDLTYLTFIPYVNGRELLERALKSIECMWPNTIVVDNSPDQNLKLDDYPVRIYTPDVPLWFAQTQNLMQKIALIAGVDVFFFMHHDAEAHSGSAELFLKTLKLATSRWGILFCNDYDSLCCFKTEAVREVGGWDWQLFPWYYADSDYYRRMRLKGYDTLTIPEVAVTHHRGGSNTAAQDPELKVRADALMKYSYYFYIMKWGAEPRKETFTVPFNGDPLATRQAFEKLMAEQNQAALHNPIT